MTRNQEQLIELARNNNNEFTSKQAINLLEKYYYANAGFHIGNSISKMVKSGILERTKKGRFKLLIAPIHKHIPVQTNQLKLFN